MNIFNQGITAVLHVAKYINCNDRLCNHDCLFCMERMELGCTKGILPTIYDIDYALSRFTEKMGKLSKIYVAGGEPTLRDDLPSIVEVIRKYCSNIVLSSGCDYADEDYFVDLIVRLGVKTVATSLHGSNARTHDKLTGSLGSYKRTISVMRKLLSKGISMTVNSVICSVNILEMSMIASMFQKNNFNINKLTFTHYMHHGNAYYHNELKFNVDDYIDVISDTLEKSAKISHLITFRNFPFCLDNRLIEHQEILNNIYIIGLDELNTTTSEIAPTFVQEKCYHCSMYTNCPKYLMANYGGE